MTIKVVPLGAGQDVGRSCILVCMGGKNIMFDAGMHAGFDDHRRFPNFDFISKSADLTPYLDCVIISHFHLDHCGALPFFSEVRGYSGPIIMTYPTKAICPILLEDYRKIAVEKAGTTSGMFSADDVRKCMTKVTAVSLHETIQCGGIEITAYYAGHVLGAAMFHVRVGEQSVLYSGDYNMTPDRHLGAASVPCLMPDVLITESTYATTIRDSKRLRERQLLQQITECVSQGGKVLIPVFALGRAQELLILVETYWERMKLDVPVYFSQGLSARANQYYKLFISWTSQKIKETFLEKNMFEFRHIQPFDKSFTTAPGPMVVFATPGMLHAGQSLEIFKAWCDDEKNLKQIRVDRLTTIDVNCKVSKVSFSAHADSKGILQLIKEVKPRNVVLVHGERSKMNVLAQKIEMGMGTPCFFPANGTVVTISAGGRVPVLISNDILERMRDRLEDSSHDAAVVDGVLISGLSQQLRLVTVEESVSTIRLPSHCVQFQISIPLPPALTKAQQSDISLLAMLSNGIATRYRGKPAVTASDFKVESIRVAYSADGDALDVSWDYRDEMVATCVRQLINDAIRMHVTQ
ncbi:unnamed protein product (mitochondrion) [Plasmodiophora brassicae]|uniref:Integrator complex subunit 11 n=1 Tax=Plasmodiophora brassicae TaxID=37360 RepID=A0A3P3Y1E7_PLABS|nr:unnamed protein product [Plasmodiophora brassicae]